MTGPKPERGLQAPEVQTHEAPIVDHDAVAPEPLYQDDPYQPPSAYTHYQYTGAKEQDTSTGQEPVARRKICGLRPVTFWLTLALVVIVIGAAVGGGVGGSMAGEGAGTAAAQSTTGPSNAITGASDQSESLASTPTPTSANVSIPATASYATSGETGLAALSCTDDNIYSAPSGSRFEEHCETNWYAGLRGTEGSVQDISNVITYTFEACMDRCDRWNSRDSVTPCRAVTYDQNLTSSVSHNGGNCVLKSTSGATDPAYDYIASAVQLQ